MISPWYSEERAARITGQSELVDDDAAACVGVFLIALLAVGLIAFLGGLLLGLLLA